MKPWWESAFGPDYAAVYAHRDDASAAAEVAGLLPRLRAATAATGLPILDAGCGGGRHLAALHAAGLSAHGFDLSPALLSLARARPDCAGRLVQADQRVVPFAAGSFAAVVVLFTGFGYFDDVTNAQALAGLASLVAPGGWLVLDLPDPARVRATLVAHSQRRLPDGRLVDEARALVGQHVEKTVSIAGAGPYTERVRLYEPTELAALVRTQGLTWEPTWSSLRGPDQGGDRLVAWIRQGV
jgi:SAM-dependent methyltransferase